MNQAKETWILLGVLLLLVGVAWFGFYGPQNRKLDQLHQQIAAAETKLETEAAQSAVLPELRRQIDAMKKRYKDFDRKLPKRKELGGFLKEISHHLAGKDLSETQSIEPGSPRRQDLFYTLPINIRFHGSYLSTAEFLKEIDHMERLTRIQRLLIRSPKSKDAKDLDIEMQLNIYFTES